jgi:hypothetical protein
MSLERDSARVGTVLHHLRLSQKDKPLENLHFGQRPSSFNLTEHFRPRNINWMLNVREFAPDYTLYHENPSLASRFVTAAVRPAELGSCGDARMRFLVLKNKMNSLPKMVIKDRCLGAIMTVRRDIV